MNSSEILSTLQRKIGSANWQNWQVHRWQFYDYVRYPVAGTSQLAFFVNPQGSTDPTSAAMKTLEETNCPKARSFGQVYFVVQQIRTHINPLPKGRQNATVQALPGAIGNGWSGAMRALEALAHQGVLNFKIGQKDYFDINQPFITAPPGCGIDIIEHCNMVVITGSYWLQQSRNLDDVHVVTPPQLIEPEQTIDLTIDFPNATSTALTGLLGGQDPRVNIGVILDGYIARPAQ